MHKILSSSIILILASLADVLAQNGYKYDRPQQPFPGPSTTKPNGSQSPTQHGGYLSPGPSVAGGPTTPYPRATGGYPSGIQSSPSFPGAPQPQRPGFPSSFPPQYQTTPSGPRGPATGFPGSQAPSNGYPAPSGSQSPSTGYPQSQAPRGPQGPSPGYPQPQQGYPQPQRPTGAQGSGPEYHSPQAPPGTQGQPGFPVAPPGQSHPSAEGFLGPSVPHPDEGTHEEGDYSAIPGEPDRDYPIYSEIPQTSFRCDQQQYPGYYADVETRCQVFHICANNRTYDFLCPNGTIFHQEYLVCVWWHQFDCNTAPSLYGVNANIYDYSIMGSFQESGVPFGGPHGPAGPQQQIPYPAQSGPTASPAGFPGQGQVGPGAQGPSTGYPGSNFRDPYPGQSGPTAPSAQFPSPGAQGSSAQGSGVGYHGGPSTTYPGHSIYPGSGPIPGKSQGTSAGYPVPTRPSVPFPGSSSPFPGGSSSFPGPGTVQQPNREYLPPVNG